jgi:hypothetical protein
VSDFRVIRAVSRSMRQLLEQTITIPPGELNGVPIDLRSPKELRQSGVNQVVSLWLYRVTRDPDMVNSPGKRVAFEREMPRTLPLHLYYLVTPMSPDPADEQNLLGRVLQTFHDNCTLRGAHFLGQPPLESSDEQLRVVFETLTLEELTRIWTAIDESYQLSVSYLVQVVKIDSDRESRRGDPVLERIVEYDQVL